MSNYLESQEVRRSQQWGIENQFSADPLSESETKQPSSAPLKEALSRLGNMFCALTFKPAPFKLRVHTPEVDDGSLLKVSVLHGTALILSKGQNYTVQASSVRDFEDPL